MLENWDTIILGGGAAGLFCAAEAARGSHSVLVLEHNRDVGKKILISGGGRCNFTNMYAEPENYLSQNPHFCKSALARYTPWDFIALVDKYGIGYHEKKWGQLFCNQSAQAIVDLLLSECREQGVKIQTGVTVQRVEKRDLFTVHTPNQTYQSRNLVLATGGLSIPKIGASPLGYRLLKQFNHRLTETRPGLVPLCLPESQTSLNTLRGISVDVRVSLQDMSFRENLLFTHFGLSGPAILQISSYWQPGQPLSIQFLPDLDWHATLEAHSQSAKQTQTLLAQYLPKRLAQTYFKAPNQAFNQITSKQKSALLQALMQTQVIPSKTAGYKKAEVTVGGADTRDFSSQTMASNKVRGLYCIGELMDVTGWLGGYNFQWAWASAAAAGRALAKQAS